MDYSKAALVVCLTLVMVILFNVMIYVSLTNKRSVGFTELLRRAAKRAKNPWETEDADLRELSGLVAKLKEEGSQEHGGAEAEE